MAHEKLRPQYFFDEEKIAQLKKISPECFEDGKINFETLKQNLGEWTQNEDDNELEHFGLFWPGKRNARKAAALGPEGTLVPVYGDGLKANGTPDTDNENDSKNIFIEGENLEVLKLLQKSYSNKIKMIYIDPPYNTGNDFVYDDDFTEPLQEYLRRTGQVDEDGKALTTNKRSDGRFHSKWLSMMYPRLRLARNLLKEDGAIFISIDGNELAHLKILLNEIFGEENFVGQLTIINNLKGRNDKKNIAQCHEYLVIYQKSNFTSNGLPLTEEQLKQFKYEDENGEKYALRDLRKRGRPDRKEDRPNMHFAIFYDEERNIYSLERLNDKQVEIVPKRGDLSDGRWRWGKDSVEKNLNILHAKYSKKKDRWDIEHRVYLNPTIVQDVNEEDDFEEMENVDDENNQNVDDNIQRTSKSKSFWIGGEISSDVGRRELKNLFDNKLEFDYPKATEFLKKCIHMGLSKDEIVLDFFAGSASIAQSVYELNKLDHLNRKFICVQIPEPIDISSASTKETKKTIQKNIDYLTSINKPLFLTEISKLRILKSSAKIINEVEHGIDDLGVKIFSLRNSNFKPWKNYKGISVSELEEKLDLFNENPLRDGYNNDGLLSEIMLLHGFTLCSDISKLGEIKKNDIVKISSEFCQHSILVCLDKNIEKQTITDLHLNDADIFICLDSAIANEDKLRLSDKGLIQTI